MKYEFIGCCKNCFAYIKNMKWKFIIFKVEININEQLIIKKCNCSEWWTTDLSATQTIRC